MRFWPKTGLIVGSLAVVLALNTAGCPTQVPGPLPDGDPITDRNQEPQPDPQPDPQPQPAPKPAAPTLFVTNISTQTVQSFTTPASRTGDVLPTGNVAGAQTRLSGPYDAAVTLDGQLIVSNHVGSSLNFYPNAETATGNVEPRVIAGPLSGLQSPRNLAWDKDSDGLFVSDASATAPIKVFASVSSATTVGDVTPARTIRSADIKVAMGISLTAGGTLFVANGDITQPSIPVFDNARTLNGDVAASRVIRSAAFNTGGPFDIHVGADDTLFVVTADNRVVVFRNASTLNGQVAAGSTLTVSGGASLRGITVDRAGVGYLANQSAQPTVLVFDALATRNGTFPADRTIGGAQTQISSPWGVFVWE